MQIKLFVLQIWGVYGLHWKELALLGPDMEIWLTHLTTTVFGVLFINQIMKGLVLTPSYVGML